jgi:nitroreductase
MENKMTNTDEQLEVGFESVGIKEARTEKPVKELIRKRWSARSFNNQEISHEELETILEAASWAFSAMNYQPWRYYYAHKNDESAFNKLLNCLAPGNQVWAKNASVLIASVVKTSFDNGSPNSAAKHDLGAANATLVLQAQSMNIYSHLMGGFDKDKAIAILQLDSEEYEPVVIIALGYLDEPEKLVEPFRTRELTKRVRKSLSQFSFPVEK